MNPGIKLALIRRKNGFTQAEVAKELGISVNSLSKYERGELPLPGTVFVRLTRKYKCTIFDIYNFNADNIEFDIPREQVVQAQVEMELLEERNMHIKATGTPMPEAYYMYKQKKLMDKYKHILK